MDAKLTIPVCGLLGEKFSGETPLRWCAAWGVAVCSRFDSCKTGCGWLGGGDWTGFRSYQICCGLGRRGWGRRAGRWAS